MDELIERLEGAPHDGLVGESLRAIKELSAWQEKVCSLIQPAEDPDEWGMDVADIIAGREEQRAKLEWELDGEVCRSRLAEVRIGELEQELAALRDALEQWWKTDGTPAFPQAEEELCAMCASLFGAALGEG